MHFLNFVLSTLSCCLMKRLMAWSKTNSKWLYGPFLGSQDVKIKVTLLRNKQIKTKIMTLAQTGVFLPAFFQIAQSMKPLAPLKELLPLLNKSVIAFLHEWDLSLTQGSYCLYYLLAYNSCAWGYIVTFAYVLTMYIRFTSIHHSPSSPPLLIRTNCIALFSHMNTKYNHYIHSHSLCLPSPLPTGVPIPRDDLVLTSWPSFFLKCILII
jgi:hypothetical protein